MKRLCVALSVYITIFYVDAFLSVLFFLNELVRDSAPTVHFCATICFGMKMCCA